MTVKDVSGEPTPPDYPFRAPTALEPPEAWEKLRSGCPVADVRLVSGDTAVVLTRYDDVKQTLADPRFDRQLTAEGAARISTNESGGVFNTPNQLANGAAHQAWRRLVIRSFTARRMAALQPRIEAKTDELIDQLQLDGSPADLVPTLAFPLPVWVICELLGIDDKDRDLFAYWAQTMLSLTKYSQAEVDAAQAEFDVYMADLVTAKRATPGDDLTSELLAVADSQDGRLSEQLAVRTARGLLVAGHETTANMIGKMVAMLLADRRRWDELLADPELVPSAIEEVLRFDPNAGFGVPRYLTEDLELESATLPRGTTVIVNMAAANRDERAFEQPDEMDLHRNPNRHLSFGVGPRSCIGQVLARTELQTVLAVLLRRLPSLDLAIPADQLPIREGMLVGGIERLPVRW
jgi:cytochrome P450